jgi:DNA polymerase-3 subunit epsilon
VTRPIVVVDLETSALEPNTRLDLFRRPKGTYGVATEAAWWNLHTDQSRTFVPRHDVSRVLTYGAVGALEVSHYAERLATAEQDDGTALAELHDQLLGATLAGANPTFDARYLEHTFRRLGTRLVRRNPTPWHYRLLDVSAYYAGALGVPGNQLPGLAKVTEALGVTVIPDHSAAADTLAAGHCLLTLGAVQPLEATTAGGTS